MAVRLSVRHAQSAAGLAGDVSYELEQGRIAIGRGAGADVRLPHLTVSEMHATLEHGSQGYCLRDEGSTNGTWVNGTPLVPLRTRTLHDGDEIEIGEFKLTFRVGASLGSPVSPERTSSLARRLLREMLGREHASASPPYLQIEAGPDEGTVLNLSDPPAKVLVGRGDEADLVLNDPDVSRLHLEILRDADGTLARDLESKNGLSVNGKRLRERRLRHGDALRLGATSLVYYDPAEEALRGLEGQHDVTITRTQPQRAESGAPPAPVPALVASAPRESRSSGTDLIVYGFAFAVMMASLLGLFWLFGS